MSDDPTHPPLDKLTERQIEVLSLASMHLENKLIAHQLEISERAVEKHFQGAGNTLGVSGKNAILRKYRELTAGFGNTEYGTSPLDQRARSDERDPRDLLREVPYATLNPLAGLEAFDARFGGIKGRMLLYLGALGTLVVVLALVTFIALGASDLIDRHM